MYTFIWLLSYIKICYLYLNKSRLLREHWKAYKLKSEVLQLLNLPKDQGWCCSENTCFLPFWPGYIQDLAFQVGWVCFDPRPNSNHFAENHTLGNVNFLFTNFGLFSCCIYRLKKKVFRQLWLQTRKTSTKKQNATRKNCEILELLLRNLIFSWKEKFR